MFLFLQTIDDLPFREAHFHLHSYITTNSMTLRVYVILLLALFCAFATKTYAQASFTENVYLPDGDLDPSVYAEYKLQTAQLLQSCHIDLQTAIFSGITHDAAERTEFENFLGSEWRSDRRELVLEVGAKKIANSKQVNLFIEQKIKKYKPYYVAFKKRKTEDASRAKHGGSDPMPFAAGQPCQNMDFETQTMNGWVGSYGSCSDPTLISGFNNLGINSPTGQHTIMTSGSDPNVSSIPCVMPGGTASLRLGDNGGGGREGARISQTFQVQAANPYFTYNYAVVLEDAGHPVAQQPYFRIRMYDGSNNLIACATLDIDATNAPGLTSTASLKYKNWTQVVIPLTSYIGQNVTIQFTTGDCDASGGTHDGYAYIDCSCQPPQIVTSSPVICGGTSITVTAPSGLASYSWAGPGIVSGGGAQTVTVNQPGTYTVTMTTNTTAPNVPCTFSLDTIIPGSLITPTANFTSDVVCTGGTTTFTDASTPAASITSWSWDFDANSTIDATTQNPTHTFPGAGTYAVTLTVAAGGCTNTHTANVTVNPGVTPSITASGPYCENAAPVTLSATPAGGTWSGTGITNASTGQFTPSHAIVGNDTVHYSVSGSCAATASSVIVVNALPVAEGGPPVTICSGTAASIGTSSTTGYTYGWTPAAGLSATNVSNPSVTTVNSGTTPITTLYTVTATANSCSSTDTVTVIVNPQPALTITDPAAVCMPSTVDLTAASVTAGSTGGGTLTYWTDAGATVALASPNAVATSGTYYIKATAVGGCTDIKPVNVTVNPLPASNAGPDITICTGTPATLGVAATAGESYSWSPAAGLSNAAISNPDNTTTNSGTTAIVTTYVVTTMITATGCQSRDTAVVTVNPFPVLAITNPAAVCAPSTVDITAPAITAGSVGSGTMSYWMDAAATTLMTTPSAISASGTYYIKMTSGTGCNDMDSVIVTINPLPVSNAGPDVVICTGSSASLGAAAVAGNTYSWSPATGLSATNTANPTVMLTNMTLSPVSYTYIVTTVTTATGCQSADTVMVTVNPVATANAGSSQSVCSGSGITLAGAVGGSASGGSWSGGAGSFSPNNTTLNAVYTPSAAEYAAGAVTLTLTTDDPAGPCTFASSSVTFHFYENPVIAFTVDDPDGCPVHCASFTDHTTIGGGDNIVSWDWNFGDGGLVDSTTQNTSHCFHETNYYDVTLTAISNHGCVSTLTNVHMVHVFAMPQADFNPVPTTATVLNPVVTLENASSNDVTWWHYTFGDGDTSLANDPSPVHTYPNAASSSYLATLVVHNADGCYDTVSKPLNIGPEFTFFIPNAFTPNGDGVNDYFFGEGIGIKEYDIWIFDRWGNMIYHGDNIYSSKWDGKANHGSDAAQQDVYVWKVKLTDVFGKKHDYMGTVTLVR